jgi:hypothetical protein
MAPIGADKNFVLFRRVDIDTFEFPNNRTQVRRFGSMRLFGLMAVAGILLFSLWRANIFQKWAGGATGAGTTATTFYLGDGGTIMDKTQAGGATWLLVSQPTADGRLCYQLADDKARIILSCVGAGIAPMKPGGAEVAQVLIPPLATKEAMPPVIMGATATSVARVELSINDTKQSITPVAWPELGRNGFVVPIDPALAKAFLTGTFIVAAYDANNSCVGALKTIPTDEMVLKATKDCPK